MQISTKKVVSIDYTLKDDDGETIDSSEGSTPLAYIHGIGGLIPGLEKALEGKQASQEKLSVKISPEEGYGIRDERLVQSMDKEAFKGIEPLEVGMQFQAGHEGHESLITITEIEGDKITVDGNHPLAGMTLHFEVIIRDVRDATPEELDHGHVHGEGGHHH